MLLNWEITCMSEEPLGKLEEQGANAISDLFKSAQPLLLLDLPRPFSLFAWIDRTLMRTIHTGDGTGLRCHRPSLFLSGSNCLHFSRSPKIP